MPLDQERTRLIFRRLSRHLGKLSTKPVPEEVHQFRTYSRRLEALLEDIVPDGGRNEKKLVKLISRMRKKAGRVRDLDVQIVALRGLKISQDAGRKAQLLRALGDARAQREKKLLKAFDPETVRELRKRLKRASADLQLPADTQPLEKAIRLFAEAAHDRAPLTEERLHQYRIAGKRVRYIAELAGNSAEAERVVEQLKRMQDALGEWHDWLTLTANAEERFGGTQDSPLVSALRNVTRAKFRHAVGVVMETRSALLAKPATELPQRKPVAAQAALAAAIA